MSADPSLKRRDNEPLKAALKSPRARMIARPLGSAIAAGERPAHEQDDLFELVWPTLARRIAEPRTEREIADALGLELTQA